MKKHIISILVDNQAGVLIRVSLVFARRSYNIDSLVTHPTQNHKFSIITITVRGESSTIAQIIKQLNKLIDVICVTDTRDVPSVQLEMTLMKVRCNEQTRIDILHIFRSMNCSIVDVSKDAIIVSCVGDEARLNALENILESYGIIETIRTGAVLMARGAHPTVS